MAINLKAAAKVADADIKNTKLGAVILGTPSAGKSGILGTFGCKTLYAYFGGESHGPVSTFTHATSEVIPYPLSLDDEGKALNADQSYKRLLDLLRDKDTLKAEGIGAVAIDGLTELENAILETASWKQRVEVEKNGVTAYSGDVTVSMFRPVLDALRSLQRDIGIHYAVTCILDVRKYDDTGTILDSMPKLKGYDVATGIILQFPDRLMIGPIINDEGVAVPRLQMTAKAHRNTADQKTKVIKKTYNFRVQLAGCDMATFPETLRPDLSRMIKYKEAKKYFKIEG
jgi:hypothetical protein